MSVPLLGQMMDAPLLLSALLTHAKDYHGDTEVVSRTVEGGIHRYTYADAAQRSRQLANALKRIGVGMGDRVGTLAWNGYRHFELYYAVSGSGAVMHTVNPRLFPEQVAWIINDAEDSVLCFDLTFAPLVEAIAPKCPTVKHWVAMTDRAHMPAIKLPNLLCYEDWVEAESDEYEWPQFDEKAACTLCYTSGTTGNPKGVLYSHRSMMIHTMSGAVPDVFNLSARDCVLPVVPMFHVNAWAVPYAAPMVGAKLVFPGAALDGASLHELFESEGVTFSAGVPTVWQGLLQHLQANKLKVSTLKRCVIGGSACPPALMKTFEQDYGVKIHHAWGMTEMSPLGTFNQLKNKHLKLSAEQQFAIETKQGRPPFGVQLKIVDADGRSLPRDGHAFGDLLVKGYWIVDRYFKGDKSPLQDGWFPTGDVGTLDSDGYLQITDRSKDVIKSGGEWISSIDLENVACAHPGVAQAAVIGVHHPKWDERPLLVVVKKPGEEVDRDALLAIFPDRVAKWWIPDDVVFVSELPMTATGKISKLRLREQLKDHRLPGV
ncbi:fatty-acid--CoA ligase [Sinimarinibacterium sp. CAU 1509]|uniref:3-(methylthio)propionyl-CoA ligase n=1 Tax=Sinimarinibacterium sp. CAU 1509 TaxID=2562283 RepID=UPI0010ACB48C|nr:3-(methylthio)propionyl-CoA ligase [Sinimarinibacterium sp. CAU 1509]TJY59406.1 fatty-acid--CoA ligase [Sinimarinibacterium sp. CAU 1509]